MTRTLAALNKAKRKVGIREIPYFTIRMLRHWFISWALNRPVDALSETQLIKIVGHADFAMIRDTYYHLDVEGESGRKMRGTPLFSGLFASGDAVKVDEKQVNAIGSTDSDGGDDIMFNFSLRGA